MIKKTLVILIILSFSFSGFSQSWQMVGGGMNWEVRGFYTDTATNTLYIGGGFSTSGGIPTWGVTSWNGVIYDSLGSGMLGMNPFPVFGFIRYKGNLYAAGMGAPGIVKWDGTSWQTVGGGLNGTGGGLYIYNDELYVCGIFDTAGTVPANGLAKWNDTIWSDVHALPNYNTPNLNQIFKVIEFQGELYAGGNFQGTGRELVKWNGVSWQTVGGGFQGGFAQVNDLVIYNNELYVGGSFSKSAGNPGDAIAKWDGNQWYYVGGGMTNANGVFDLQVFNNELYAVGGFTMAGGVPAYGIAKWDGNEWCGLGNFPNGGPPTSIAIYNNELYLGCDLTFNNDTVNYIVKWTGGSIPIDTCGAIVGINEALANNHDLLIYPNPNNGNFTIEVDVKGSGDVILTIYGVLGQKIFNKEYHTNSGNSKEQVNLSHYGKGVYFVELNTESEVFKGKFVIN